MIKYFSLVIHQERCIGREACTVACRIENKGFHGWIRIHTMNSASKDTPTGHFPELKMHFLPILCQHWENPHCADACRLEGIRKREDGPVVLNKDRCDGCQACLGACPYDAIIFNYKTGKAEKCNFCAPPDRTGT